MASRAENEGMWVLDDFVCDAILEPGIPRADPRNQGGNEGTLVVEELVVEQETDRANEGKPAERGMKQTS